MKRSSCVTYACWLGSLAVPAMLVGQPSPPPAPSSSGTVIVRNATALADANREIERNLAVAQSHAANAYGSASGGGTARSEPTLHHSGVLLMDGPPASSDVWLLHSTEPTRETSDDLKEDLAVMTRVLERALSPDLASHGQRAMGLDLVFAPEQPSTEALYLEDYGAIFRVQVRFPLLPPAETASDTETQADAEDSEWEAARRELYGAPQPAHETVTGLRFSLERNPPEPYSHAKVEELVQTVLTSLKQSARIRHLQPDDYLLVCVKGAPAGSTQPSTLREVRREVEAHSTGSSNRVMIWNGQDSRPRQGTLLTLRVLHADAVAFADGLLNLEGLRHRARIQTYTTGNSPAP